MTTDYKQGKMLRDCWGRICTTIIDDNTFQCEGINYERDEFNDRCYRLEESISLRPEMDGALVKHRISKAEYEEMLAKAKALLSNAE